MRSCCKDNRKKINYLWVLLFCRCWPFYLPLRMALDFSMEIKEAGSLMNLCRENIAYPIILVIVVLIGFVALVVCKDSAVRYWRSKRKALDRNVGE